MHHPDKFVMLTRGLSSSLNVNWFLDALYQGPAVLPLLGAKGGGEEGRVMSTPARALNHSTSKG